MKTIPKAILWGGLGCGVLDLTAACIDAAARFKFGPVRLLQNVAGALLGPATYEGGAATAVLGLLMHLTVAFTAATGYYFLARRFPALLRWTVVSGLVYGAVVFLVMYRGVVPLTIWVKSFYLTVAFNRTWPPLRLSQLGVHLGCVGLPIAVAARRWGVAES